MTNQSPLAIVTGAGGNLGSAVSKFFTSAGIEVIGTVRPGGPENSDGKLHYRELDLLNPEACVKFLRFLSGTEHRINAAVFCAGGFDMHKADTMGQEDLQKMIRLNFETAFHLSQGLFKLILERKHPARFVFIGAIPALHPAMSASMASYSISKRMVIQWSEILDTAGSKAGFRSFVVAPGTIDTPENREAMPNADRKGWISPDDLAREIHHLCFDAPETLTTSVFEY